MEWQKKIHGFNAMNDNSTWIERMNAAIDYIEKNLDSEINVSEVAKHALCSSHHFQRIFSFMTNTSLSEYIRRRRLTNAAFELKEKGSKVIDLSIKYGYESPEAFTRAFKAIHGISPTVARKDGVRLRTYPKLVFHITIRGDVALDYKIENREGFDVFGIGTVISTVNQQDFIDVPKFWRESRENGSIDRIRAAAMVSNDTPVHGALYNCTDTQYEYLLCLQTPPEGIGDDFIKLTIPDGTWAVFSTGAMSQAEAAEQAGHLWKRIFTEWFAVSGYELANAPEMEMHYKTNENKYITEIWIPVTKNI